MTLVDGNAVVAFAERIGSVVVFLLAITVAAEVAERAGVFDVAGHRVAHWGRHRAWALWVLFAVLAVACTVVLSIDTTAVLLTPVGLAVARQVGLDPRVFAVTTLWVANTGSLLLPVSNLTNLLGLHTFGRLGLGHWDFVRLAWVPALACVVATLVLVAVLHRRTLRARYAVDPPPDPHDPVLLRWAGAVCLALGPFFALGAPPWAVSLVAAAALLVVARWRAPDLLRGLPVPWLMAGGFVAVSVAVELLHGRGLTELVAAVVPDGSGTTALLGVAGVGAVLANVVNNLPAYLVVEPVVADAPVRLMALLVGVNAGPLVTPWALAGHAAVAPAVPGRRRRRVVALARPGRDGLRRAVGRRGRTGPRRRRLTFDKNVAEARERHRVTLDGHVSLLSDLTRIPQQRLGHALRARVAGDDASERAAVIWGKRGERWFTPEDPVWRVHADAAMFPGGVAALLLQSLHPLAMAGVAGHSGYRGDPWGRLQRTSGFLATTTFGTVEDAEAAIARVRAVHERVRGTDERGRPYRASDPHLLAWVHVAEAHGFLTAYQRWADEPLTPEEADTYVRQSAVVAERLGATDLPLTVAELREALEAYRPELEATTPAREAARFLLLDPPLPWAARPGYGLIATGGVAILPVWARVALRLPVLGPVALAARGIGGIGTKAVRWAMAGVAEERQVTSEA